MSEENHRGADDTRKSTGQRDVQASQRLQAAAKHLGFSQSGSGSVGFARGYACATGPPHPAYA